MGAEMVKASSRSSRDHATVKGVEPVPQIEMVLSCYIPAFECALCARCCTGKVIALFGGDIRRLGKYAEACTEPMSEEEIALTGAERKMKMVDDACVFLEGSRCSHYDLRPDTCRRHPFIVTKRHILAASTCKGIDWTGRWHGSDGELLRLSEKMAPKIDDYIGAFRGGIKGRRGSG